MDMDPVSRRGFLGLSGGAIICTLAGQKIRADEEANLPKLSRKLKVPPKVAAAKNDPGITKTAIQGNRKEYWITAEQRRWNIVPTNKDQMMNRKVKVRGGKQFQAYAYRQYSANFAAPLGPATIPGPLIDAEIGDTVIIHFRNLLPTPVTMHPHGVFYSNEMDGAYKGWYTDPGGFVQKNRTFTYVWECVEGTQGTWMYHDHGPMDPIPLYKGLFGPMVIRDPNEPRPDREFFLGFHSFTGAATGLREEFSCINGKSYAGNTPTLEAKLGERVRWHVYGLDEDFHTFHIHGHRWEENGAIIDNKTFGPGDSFKIDIVEDNPGRWFYHCHVFSHLHHGMNGWYLVS